MIDLKAIKAQHKINKQAKAIQCPQAFTAKFPTLSADKKQKLFDRYVSVVCGAMVRQATWLSDNQLQVSFEQLFNKCGTFNINNQRHSVWNEFKDISPFFRIVELGNNLTGRNTIVEVTTANLKKLLNYTSAERIIEEMYDGVDGQPEFVKIDLQSLQNYVDNTEYDLAYNSAGKGRAWVNKLERNRYQALIVQRIATELDGLYPQFAKPSVFGRVYYAGLSIQSMSKDVRAAALGGHFQYDMNAAIYGIKLALMNEVSRYRLEKPNKEHIENDLAEQFTYTKEYLQEKEEIRNRLAVECIKSIRPYVDRKGKDQPQKSAIRIIKDAITAIGFGAETDLSDWFSEEMALVDIIKNPEDRQRFLSDPWVAKFAQEQEEIGEGLISFLKEVGQFDAIKNAIKAERGRKRVTNAHILAYAFQHYETDLMDRVTDIVAQQTPVLARIHDAFITAEELHEDTMEAVQDELARSHSLISLDVERSAVWRPLAERKVQDAESDRIAEHKARMADKEREAHEFFETVTFNPFAGTRPEPEPKTLDETWDWVLSSVRQGHDISQHFRLKELQEVYGNEFETELERRFAAQE